jgi:hypothetical protein
VQVNNASLNSFGGRLRAIVGIEFFENALYVVLHRVFSDPQLMSDLLISKPIDNELEYRQFAAAQYRVVQKRSQDRGHRRPSAPYE